MTQQLKSKAWADIVESLIGLIYLEAGEKAAMEFLVYLGIISDVPQGFEREQPTVHITEVNMASEDGQLAAEIAAVETAAANMDVSHADAAAPEAVQAGDAAAEPAVDVAAGAAGDAAADSACGAAAEPAGDADVAMTDAIESAGAAQVTDLRDTAPNASAVPTPTAAASASITAEMHEEATDAQLTDVVSGDHSKSADKGTAPSADSTARDSDAESDMVVDNSGYGHTSSYQNGGPLDPRLHPAQPSGVQPNGAQHNGVQPNGLHANGVDDCLPELSVSSANGRGASAALRSDAETRSGKASPASTALASANLAADNLPPHANGHVAMVIKQESYGTGFVDPNVIDIGDGEDKLLADGSALPQLKQEPKQEMAQSGYLCQSGYGDIELSESDSEQSESPNPEEISIAEPEEELLPVSPSSSHPAQPMDTEPPAVSTPPTAAPAPAEAVAAAPELANGDAPPLGLSGAAPVQPSGGTVKIKIEPGLEAGGAAETDQNQIEMDAMAFLAMNDDDSEDELPQARPRRGQVSFQSCVHPSLAIVQPHPPL